MFLETDNIKAVTQFVMMALASCTTKVSVRYDDTGMRYGMKVGDRYMTQVASQWRSCFILRVYTPPYCCYYCLTVLIINNNNNNK